MINRYCQENRVGGAESNSDRGFERQESEVDRNSELHNGKGKPWNKQCTEHWKWCCYGNYKGIAKANVKVAMTIMARDCHGISGGYTPSNLVIEIYD